MSDANTGADPRCPFCRAPWTRDMLDLYDAMTDPHGCACCHGSGAAHGHEAPAHKAEAADICCASCGKAIYRALALPPS